MLKSDGDGGVRIEVSDPSGITDEELQSLGRIFAAIAPFNGQKRLELLGLASLVVASQNDGLPETVDDPRFRRLQEVTGL